MTKDDLESVVQADPYVEGCPGFNVALCEACARTPPFAAPLCLRCEHNVRLVAKLRTAVADLRRELADADASMVNDEKEDDGPDVSELLGDVVRRHPLVKPEGVEFIECDTCSAKPGSSVLCVGCQRNRAAVNLLKARVALLEEKG